MAEPSSLDCPARSEMANKSFLYQALKIVSLCLLWYTFSSGNNIVGKKILSEFPYPMTLSMVSASKYIVYPLLSVRRSRSIAIVCVVLEKG